MACARIAAISAISQCDAGSQSIPTIDGDSVLAIFRGLNLQRPSGDTRIELHPESSLVFEGTRHCGFWPGGISAIALA